MCVHNYWLLTRPQRFEVAPAAERPELIGPAAKDATSLAPPCLGGPRSRLSPIVHVLGRLLPFVSAEQRHMVNATRRHAQQVSPYEAAGTRGQ